MKKEFAEIDLQNKRKLYVVKNGELIAHDLPEHGETVIVTHQGEAKDIITTVKTRL
ncbi:XtrA/YqaO family protein [Cytobacillus sp. IB215665]|uniref:XtrA/YqaO family protein n=1 Tax=Cytobacillus sp. IB215665 TaxID=3097357 RepID=UPI002A0BF337|nr:XtrA/YqaO family protein [Cytobacillus sp. IB215665]MDX8366787.1 XtrA/YqaO family protein [Cytobacillus sp. IB215665]